MDHLNFIAPTLERLIRHTEEQDQIIVVDRGAADATQLYLDWVARTRPGAFELVRPGGYLTDTEAVLQGLEAVTREVVVLLRATTSVTPGWLPPLVAALEADPQLAAVGPLLDFTPGIQSPAFHTGELPGVTFVEELAEPVRSHCLTPVPTEALAGSCILLRTDALRAAASRDPVGFLGPDRLRLVQGLRQLGGDLVLARTSYVRDFFPPRGAEMTPELIYSLQRSINLLHEAMWLHSRGETPADPFPDHTLHPQTGRACVVLPVTGGLRSVRRSLESLRAHTHRDIELVIVDDGCLDTTRDWIESMGWPEGGLRMVSAEGRGVAGAADAALAGSAAAYVVLLEEGAAVGPGWLAALLAALAVEPGVGLAAPSCSGGVGFEGGVTPYGDDLAELSRFVEHWRDGHALELARGTPVQGPCMVLRMEALRAVGGLVESGGGDLCSRLATAGLHQVVATDVFVHGGAGLE